ncbi:NAD(P)H-quinone oxidoreductase [Sphingobacterium puteale]|uniref:NAD(P)H-quinone oxidoreductase n=1 Tax=Sphingobacterium puteale TaxID=2420510 RepID=A0A420VWU7_9SPHI|nr:NAD(P)H-quinone oxidoreductase [Sphingobacterium puteale]RKO70821.1 NAD(P)H-quinone oxidoreductase [Sphingobacterium puteale]
MKAVVITQPGGPDVLQVEELEQPRVGDLDVLIAVKAAGVNRPDVFQRKGNYPAPAGVDPRIPGLEVAGVIVEKGRLVDSWNIGDPVCALVAGGGYANYVSVYQGHCLPIPPNLTFEAAAALPETVFTVWDNVFRRGKLQAGDHFLVHGGAGGIGSTAIQLGVLFGAEVYTTVSSEEKGDFCQSLGASKVINYKSEDFQLALADLGVDVILDSIGGAYFEKNIALLNPDGHLVYINAMQGAKVELNLLKLMQKRITLTGSTLRARDRQFKELLRNEIWAKVWPKIVSGDFKPVLYHVLPFEEAPEAHRLMEDSVLLGKVVLTF